MKTKNIQKNNQLISAIFAMVFLSSILPLIPVEASLIGSTNNAVQNIMNNQPTGTNSNQTVSSSNSSSLISNVNTAVNNINSSNNSSGGFTCAGNTMTANEFFAAKKLGLIKARFTISQSSATAGIRNYTYCNVPVSFVSYKVYDASLVNQVAYRSVTGTVPSNSAISLNVAVPSDCMTQVDVYYGFGGMSIPANTGHTIVDGKLSGQVAGSDTFDGVIGLFCGHKPTPPPTPTLTGSCSVNPNSVNVNGSLDWSASASGGTGSYTYSWSGTDGLSGTGNSISKSYSNAGIKTGTVVITSGSQHITRNCSATVNNNVVNNLQVYCNANPLSVDVNENVNWRAMAYGGTGSYTYSWSGTDGLGGSSQNINRSYNNSGTKNATVVVTSGGQSVSASCLARVDREVNDNLRVSCRASQSNTQVNNQITWYANVSGGDGDYDYDWTGSNGLNSSSRSPRMTYDTAGSKRATVTVTDGDGLEDTATCYTNVNSVLAYSATYQPPMADAVYLSQVPYTGLADNIKLYFFMGMLALFSAWMSYIIIARQSQSEA
jgi:hypothetical protein